MIPVLDQVAEARPFCVASVHHTGTWFALNFLLQFVDQVKGVVELREVLAGTRARTGQVLHFHLTGETVHSRGVVSEFDFQEALQLLAELPTLVPVRDPMSSLISRQERHPELRHEILIEGFRKLPIVAAVPSVSMLPVDLPLDHLDRFQRLHDVARDLGLDWCAWAEWYALKWPPANTRGDYALKKAYAAGDMAAVAAALGPDYDRLLEVGAEIIPFLEQVGYADLPWWRLVK